MKNDKEAAGILDVSSLREQVYAYLRAEMNKGRLLPGTFINLKKISSRLGISTTPLRDAIIQLECEGFVTILPRRGVIVNTLSLKEIQDYLEIIGALEAMVIETVFDRIKPRHLARMQRLNDKMVAALERGDFDAYYNLNIDFHDVFLNLTPNESVRKVVMPMKQRLYDFPRRAYITEWEMTNCGEHTEFMELIRQERANAAAALWQQQHWSFTHHEHYIRRFYSDATEYLESRLSETTGN
jgi:DNA-binding GntR family transcriptional regulator